MRIAVLLLAAAVGVSVAATPAFASGGLPQIADMMAGPYMISVFNDSPTLVTGHNTLTIELPPDAAGGPVQLTLTPASGGKAARQVSLHTVNLLGGPAQGMGDMGHSSGGHDHAAMAGMEGMAPMPPMANMSDMPGMGGSDTMTLLRGSAELPDAGAWWVHLSLSDPSGQVLTSSTELVAVDGGPNPLYLFITGSLIAGAIAIGFIGRRQAAAHAR